ncbi:hypothetical protein KJ966_24715 [bacterium]|nr:hypothetical protein [bacterium]
MTNYKELILKLFPQSGVQVSSDGEDFLAVVVSNSGEILLADSKKTEEAAWHSVYMVISKLLRAFEQSPELMTSFLLSVRQCGHS